MLKNLTQFKSTINGVETLFHFENNCPVNVAKEAVFECLKWIGQLEDQAKAGKESEDQKAPEPNQEIPITEEVHE
jgi:hypothetical protein